MAAQGGEVLKFLGDGLLAVFPAEETAAATRDACRRALAAAERALAATDDLNADRRAAGEPELALDVVLHYGEVVYGNVGAARRLDFTVIGPTVNEASRIEGLCDELGQHPAAVRRRSPALRPGDHEPGRFALRGCAGETGAGAAWRDTG